jgi:hypothetical protein
MTSHPSLTAGTSQCDKIETILRQRAGTWVPVTELAFASGSLAVHSRINDLRTKRHLNVEQKNIKKGRMVYSNYRLLEGEIQAELF